MVVDLYKSVAKVECNKSRAMKANPSDAVRSCIIIIIIAILRIITKTSKFTVVFKIIKKMSKSSCKPQHIYLDIFITKIIIIIFIIIIIIIIMNSIRRGVVLE